jgi:ABC-type nickel/cobalt efflux system permease component RcnA
MPLFEWALDLDPAYFPMLNDAVRMGVIQLVVQFLFFAVNPAENPFFSTMFLQTIGFVVVGVLVYWLLVRNVFVFRSTQSATLPASGLPYVETFGPGHGSADDAVGNAHHDGGHHHGVVPAAEEEEELETAAEAEAQQEAMATATGADTPDTTGKGALQTTTAPYGASLAMA